MGRSPGTAAVDEQADEADQHPAGDPTSEQVPILDRGGPACDAEGRVETSREPFARAVCPLWSETVTENGTFPGRDRYVVSLKLALVHPIGSPLNV